MKEEIERLKHLTNVYSQVHAALAEISSELVNLENSRKGLSEVLNKARDEEREIINKLENRLGKTLGPNEILEIIKENEKGLIL